MRIRHLLLGALALAAGATHAQSLPGGSDDAPDVELLPPADISVMLDDGLLTVAPGQVVTWRLTINNVGINGLAGVVLTTALSRSLSQVSWTCNATMGSQCSAFGSGAPNESVDIARLGSVSYRITATVSPAATGTISVSVSAAAPAGYVDLTPENNRATDTDAVVSDTDVVFADGFDG